MALLDLPPELLELTLQLAVGELVDVPAVATLVTARAVCKSFRALLDGLFAPRLDGQSWEHLAIAVALKSCEDEEGGCRIGFEFASVSLADEDADGRGSDVPGSRARLDAFAAILRRHARAYASCEAHCGPTAPPMIARTYSEERAAIVVDALVERGVDRRRVPPGGHGKAVSAGPAIRNSEHPNAASARSGFGWAEIFVALDGVELPARPDFYDIPRPENRIPGPPRLDDGESDDDDDDAPGAPAAAARRQFCVIS